MAQVLFERVLALVLNEEMILARGMEQSGIDDIKPWIEEIRAAAGLRPRRQQGRQHHNREKGEQVRFHEILSVALDLNRERPASADRERIDSPRGWFSA